MIYEGLSKFLREHENIDRHNEIYQMPCSNCGKLVDTYMTGGRNNWTYKKYNQTFCSWNCMQEYERKHPAIDKRYKKRRKKDV